jgi:SAM-dependent methyltransferase
MALRTYIRRKHVLARLTALAYFLSLSQFLGRYIGRSIAARMAFNTQNQPKQAAALLSGQGRVSIYEATGGAVTAQFAAHNLSLRPPIPPNSIIHDNACGAGTVSRLILSCSPPPSDLKIYATDIDDIFLSALQSDVEKNTWPIAVSNQRSEALSFPDNYFSHSITNIGIFFTTSGGLDGAKEIHRTLQPGGVAVVNCWETLAWLFPFKQVHQALRPEKPYPTPPILWNDGKQIQKVMLEDLGGEVVGFPGRAGWLERDGWGEVGRSC